MESLDQKHPKPQPIRLSPSSSGKNSNLNPTLSKNIITIILVVVVVFIAGILLFAFLNKSPRINSITYAQCNQLEQEIDTLIKQTNYCNVDSDCIISEEAAHLGLCWSLVNKNADFASITEKRLQWQNLDCGKGRVYEQCASYPTLLNCEQNRCVGKEAITEISKGVMMTTDKTEYVRGETVMITIENRAGITKEMNPYYSIERFSNNRWIQIPYITCPCNALCSAPPTIMESGERRESIWNQKEGFCDNMKEISGQVVPGRYRIKTVINNVGDPQENRKTIYSKEFVIK